MVNLFKNGWLQVLFTIVVLWSLNNVLDSYSAQILGVNPVIYSSSAFTSCALFLLLIAGRGPMALETMRSAETWLFGLILLVNYAISLQLFSMVSATEGSLILRFSVIMSTLASWLMLARKPSHLALLGNAIIFAGVIFICNGVGSENKGAVYALMLISGIFQAARVILAEVHKPHSKAAQSGDLKSQCRVVGFIMFVVSAMFLSSVFLLAIANGINAETSAISGLPTFKDFFYSPSILVGMLAGVIFIAPIRFLEFSSIEKVKAENFLAIASLSFFATWFWEWLFSPITGVNLDTFSNNDIFAGVAITIGGGLIAVHKLTAKKKVPAWQEYVAYTSQDIERVDDSREMVANTLEHFKGDVSKSAEALGVNKGALEAILMDEKKVLAFKYDVLKSVARKYRRNVAASDSLTGLANRAGFMTALKGAAYESDVYSVIFIDLDKFKPINDTHGHDAGDFVLKGVGERLKEMFPTRSIQTRLGGDEFCVLLLGKLKHEAEALMADIQKVVAEPFTFEGKEVSVTASVGVASYPSCSIDPEELLKLADKGMYREKGDLR